MLIQKSQEVSSKVVQGEVRTVAQSLHEDGRVIGVKQSQHAIAKSMLGEGMDVKLIAKLTKLALEEVMILREKELV